MRESLCKKGRVRTVEWSRREILVKREERRQDGGRERQSKGSRYAANDQGQGTKCTKSRVLAGHAAGTGLEKTCVGCLFSLAKFI